MSESAPVARAMRLRRSHPAVTDAAPTERELLEAIEAAASVSDHGSLRPWRVIALRGRSRERLGSAIAAATGLEGVAAEKLAAKPLRAPLLLAIVVSPRPSLKVPTWEQEAVASGVAHALCLVLDEAGWGVMWRTGLQTRSDEVRRMHELDDGEELLGWLYVGGKLDEKRVPRLPISARERLTTL